MLFRDGPSLCDGKDLQLKFYEYFPDQEPNIDHADVLSLFCSFYSEAKEEVYNITYCSFIFQDI